MLIYLFNLIDVNDDEKFVNVFRSTFIILLQYIENGIIIILNPSKAVAKHSSQLRGFLSGSSVIYKILQYIITNFYP